MIMKIPVIQGIIRRRILVNFRMDPEVMQRLLPKPFRPKLHAGFAIGGICLIRLEKIRPKLFPSVLGISSENAAHRIAVLWNDEQRNSREGVFVPRRDTDSNFNHLTGGKIFPGEHQKARFKVHEKDQNINLSMLSNDEVTSVKIAGRITNQLPPSSCFQSMEEASRFFEGGSTGYSVTRGSNRMDGLILRTQEWRIEALALDEAHSSFFADERKFPKGSVEFDCALLMRNIAHEWHAAPDLYANDLGIRRPMLST
jgi:hypothetical protein